MYDVYDVIVCTVEIVTQLVDAAGKHNKEI